jgi:hypothetical protein
MKKLTKFKRAVALVLCAALLCVPLLGLAAPAAEAGTLDSSTVSGNEAPTVGESAAPETPEATEPGTEEPTPEPPACFCDVKCTATTLNADCPACVADVTGCKGKEPEKCSCETKCAGDAANEACPVCVADISKCVGKEPKPPVCSCTVKCALGAVNADCPVCKTDLTGCTGKAPEPTPAPAPSYTITIISPSGWYTKAADVEIRIEDINGTGWKKVEAKIERGGSWIDLTDDLTERNRAKVEITENCTVYVTVTDKDGKAHTKSRYIECFDRTAPTIKAGIDGKLLRVEASDELSGVDAIYIDGDRYDDLTNGTLDVRLRDLDDDYKQISVQAVDNAGNKSKTVQLNNPNYKDPDSKKDSTDKDDKKDTSTSCPDTTKPATTPAPTPTTPPATTAPTTTTPTATAKPTGNTGKTEGGASSSQPVNEERAPAPLTPDGQATVIDNATDEDGKEFYTIVTPAENTFYLVIDKQRDSDNVYFLNAVTESDLLALAEKDKDTSSAPEPVTPAPEKCSCKTKCEAGAVNTKCPVCKLDLSGCEGAEPEAPAPDTETSQKEAPKKNNTGAMVIVVLVILAVGGAGYYFKVVKPKKELDDADDFEDIQFEDGPADGEADELPEPEDYADDPDEYGDDEPTGDDTEDKEGGQ